MISSKTAFITIGITLLFLPTVRLARPDAGAPRKPSPVQTLFDPDPAHPWNRLHRLFYVREMAQGRTYVHDGPDAPFGRHGPFLVEGASHQQALATLDAFLKARDDERVKDPVKRALLQRDLWYVFDRLAEDPYFGETDPREDHQPERRAVLKRLAQVLRRLELPAAQLRALPDNYARALRRGAFPTAFDPQRPAQPFLPADLRLDGKGAWVPITGHDHGLAAPRHAQFVENKALFLPFLRLPGGRKQTEEYLAGMPATYDRGFASLPEGSQVALVRRMLLMDDQGELQLTPVTESVQFRTFPKGKEQHVFEFTLDRAGLLAADGLRPLGRDEAGYFGFATDFNQMDPLIYTTPRAPQVFLARCDGCHRQEDRLHSLNTFGFGLTSGYQGAAATDLATQLRLAAGQKKHSYSWGLLQGLREATP
jgi:hypothetical protein